MDLLSRILGVFSELFVNLWETFRKRFKNHSKSYKRSPKVSQRWPEGSQKAPQTSVDNEIGTLFGSVFGAFVNYADFKKTLNTGFEKYDRKCPSSKAPATLLKVRGKKNKNPHNYFGHACHTFRASKGSPVPAKTRKKHSKRNPQKKPGGASRRL